MTGVEGVEVSFESCSINVRALGCSVNNFTEPLKTRRYLVRNGVSVRKQANGQPQ